MMISPLHYINGKPLTARERKQFQTISFRPSELLELQMLKRKELFGLMRALGIRTYNELPIVACDDDELRSAYLLYRLRRIQHTKAKYGQTISRLHHHLENAVEYVEETMFS